ncbi:MAG TPA: nuclear transport factor 2 family protein [Acidimicrobiales bacterium]|nr:nuclear transport factor 2 family protein [Acidimicrobiales bacterium]
MTASGIRRRSVVTAGPTGISVNVTARTVPLAFASIDVSDAVLAANRRFYQAFEDRNMDVMSDLWERSDRATCTHPGWATLRGWGPIAASFFALFQGTRQMQFVLTEERAQVVGAVAWVSVDENLLGDQGGATIAAVNIFACREDMFGDQPEAWRMVCHHGSVISQPLVHEGPAEN